jgi:hypothetical protein
MTTLTDPVHVQGPAQAPVQPAAPLDPPRVTEEPRKEGRRSRRFTLRTSRATQSYASWERAIGAARSFASEHGMASTVTDDNSGTRFDVTPDGSASPSSS